MEGIDPKTQLKIIRDLLSGTLTTLPTSNVAEGNKTKKKKHNRIENSQVCNRLPTQEEKELVERYTLAGVLDDATLFRFIRAKRGNIEKVVEILLRHLTWRETFNLEDLLQEDFHPMMQMGSLYWHGSDKQGSPCLVFRAVNHDFNRFDLDQSVRFFVYVLESGLRQADIALRKELHEEHLASGQPIELDESYLACQKVDIIFDCQDLPKRNINSGFFKNVLPLLQDNFPGRLNRAFILPVGTTINTIWRKMEQRQKNKVVKSFLGPTTRAKIVLLSGNWREKFLDYFEPDELQVRLGGTSTVEFGGAHTTSLFSPRVHFSPNLLVSDEIIDSDKNPDQKTSCTETPAIEPEKSINQVKRRSSLTISRLSQRLRVVSISKTESGSIRPQSESVDMSATTALLNYKDQQIIELMKKTQEQALIISMQQRELTELAKHVIELQNRIEQMEDSQPQSRPHSRAVFHTPQETETNKAHDKDSKENRVTSRKRASAVPALGDVIPEDLDQTHQKEKSTESRIEKRQGKAKSKPFSKKEAKS